MLESSYVGNRVDELCQIFKRDISVSGSEQAVRHYGVSSPYAYEQQKKVREAMRDLEKTVIMGILSGNTLGTSSARRTMAGVRSMITTNVQSIATANFNDSWLGATIQAAWQNGGTDLNLLLLGVNFSRVMDTFNATRILTNNNEDRFRNRVREYESTFGLLTVMLSRWMPANEGMVLATNRIKVKPLRGRSFQAETIGKKGDSEQGSNSTMPLAA